VYGEVRYQAIGLIHGVEYMLVFAETEPGVRVISLRKATKSERENYAKSITG
jgi:uncharacterized DUF497 family protein